MSEKDSYNPFGDAHLRTSAQFPEIYDDSSKPTPNYTGTTVKSDAIEGFTPFSDVNITSTNESVSTDSVAVTTTNLERWQRELEARSQRLTEEEEQQRAREASIGTKAANFPPFPRCCRIKPCFYQDIDVEIPPQYRHIVKFAYGLWICYCVGLLINVIGALSVLIVFSSVPGFSSNTPTLFGVSILIFLLFVPLSYLLWFRRLYIAFKTNSSLHFFLFFAIFTLCIVSLVVEVIGIPQCGVCGWILVVMTKEKVGIMVFMIVIALIFTMLTIASFFLLLRVNIYFRSSGGSFNQAKQELSSNTAQSSTFRTVVFETFTRPK